MVNRTVHRLQLSGPCCFFENCVWLGHESVETTQTYLHTHLALKEAALAKLKPYERGKRIRFQPNDRLLAFLEAL